MGASEVIQFDGVEKFSFLLAFVSSGDKDLFIVLGRRRESKEREVSFEYARLMNKKGQSKVILANHSERNVRILSHHP